MEGDFFAGTEDIAGQGLCCMGSELLCDNVIPGIYLFLLLSLLN